MFYYFSEENVVGQTIKNIWIVIYSNPCLETEHNVLFINFLDFKGPSCYVIKTHQNLQLLRNKPFVSSLSLPFVNDKFVVIDLCCDVF